MILIFAAALAPALLSPLAARADMKTGECAASSRSLKFSVGDEKGNGGGAVVCRDRYLNITTIEFFDYWEQRIQRNIWPRGGKFGDPVVIAIDALDYVRKFSPQRAVAYEKFIKDFSGQIQWVRDMEVIDDVKSVMKPPLGCDFDQVIIRQKEILYPEDRLFLVNSQLWKAMDPFQKTGALLHEAFYDEALRFGHIDSKATRYFHVKMNSEKVGAMTDSEYAELVRSVHFPFWEFGRVFQQKASGRGPVDFNPEQLGFSADGALVSITPRDGAALGIFHPLIAPHSDYSSAIEKIDLASSPGATERKIGVKLKTTARSRPSLVLNGQTVHLKRGSELVLNADLSLRLQLTSCYQDPKMKKPFCGPITISSSGDVIP